MKAIITGSSGFIGCNLVPALVDQGYDTLGIDMRCPNREIGAAFEECNLLDAVQIKRLLCDFRPDVVFHLAAKTDLLEKRNLEGYAVNFRGTKNLIDAIRSARSVKRCIFTSSQLVCRIGYVPATFQEYNPDTLYGQSKVLMEKCIHDENGGNVEWCIVRPTTIWGPHEKHYLSFFNMVKRGLYFHCGRRKLRKSYGYVGNIAYEYIKLAEAPVTQIAGQTFYLADYWPIVLQDWADEFAKALSGKEIPTIPLLASKILALVGDAAGIVLRREIPFNTFRLNNILTQYIHDISSTESVCGILPFTMEEGVLRTVEWLRETRKD
jgi:nucleoside-diphosphate-sugar epimerase